MKNKNTFTNWRQLFRRTLAVSLSIAMFGNMVDLSTLSVDAQTTEEELTIVAFDPLSKDIREQKLEIGASEDDINFPDTLTVTVEKTQTVEKDDKEAETESTEETTETSISTEQTTEMSEETDEGSSTETEASTQTSEEATPESSSEETSTQTDSEEVQKADEDVDQQSQQEEKAEETPEVQQLEDNAGENEEARNSGSLLGIQLSALAANLLPHKMIVHAAESNPDTEDETAAKTEKIKLTDIKWEIDAGESDAEEFNSSKKYNGFCYVYTPVLPDTDEKGNKLVLGEDVELPMIYVLVGEYGVATLDNELVEVSINDKTTRYAALEDACDAISEAVNAATDGNLAITLKILQNIKLNSGYNWTLNGENKNITMTVDLNGQEIGCYYGSVWGGSGANALNMHFQNIKVILKDTDKSSSNGKLHGTFYVENYSNFTLDNTYCQVLQIGGGTAVLEGGECPYLYVGSSKTASNENAQCQVKGGTYENIVVYGGAELSIEGDATSVQSIKAVHYIQSDDSTDKDVKATVNLRGGTYKTVTTKPRNAEDVKDESKGYALSNMLAPGYGFLSQDNEESVDLTDKTEITNVKVVPVAITITKQPSIASNKNTVLEHYTAEEAPKLTIEAKSTDKLTYQWYQIASAESEDSDSATSTETAIDKATESTYQIPTGLKAGTYNYFCRVSCGDDSVKSNTVTFTVIQAVVKIVETKADGTMKETYYAEWKDAIAYLSYSSDDRFRGVEKAEVVLLQDTKCNASMVKGIGDFNSEKLPKEIIIRSEGECHKLSGNTGSTVLYAFNNAHVVMQNIRVESFVQLRNGATLTLAEKAEVVAKTRVDTIDVGSSTLIIGDAKVAAGIELNGGSTLYVKQGADISGSQSEPDKQINVTNTGNTVVLEAGAATPVFSGDGGLSIYCKNDTADWSTSLKTTGDKKIWYPITLPEGVTLPIDGENASVVSVYNGDTYGLYQNGNTTDHSINVPGEICSYYPTKDGNNNLQKISDSKFTMPAAAVTLLEHNTDAYGLCANCGKTDLAKAYANGHLHVEGLTERTYDSYPQILSKVTLDLKDGTTKELIKPNYYNLNGGSHIGVGGDSPLNSDEAEYVVHYKNNAEIYTLTQGEAGFDEAKAPQVTIKGRGNYTGEVTIYFTIGKGKASLGDIDVYTGTYNGKEQSAWTLLPLQFDADPYDQYQFTEGLIDNNYISACDWSVADRWYESGTYKSNYKVEYSTDDQKTWITEKEFGSSTENIYKITDAGKYPFYLRITGGDGLFDTLTSEKCIAEIKPRDLEELSKYYYINVDIPEGLAAYYTGKPVFPASGYQITDKSIGNGYTLVKDTDYTVSGRNNTDITDAATLIFTGKGNYSGEIRADNKFAVKYAFSPAQTTASKGYWYNGDVSVNLSDSDNNSDTDKIVYTDNIESGVSLSSNLAVYASLDDAVKGSVSGYAFTSEGKNTQTLYIKDEDNSYIGTPVDVTVQIDKTAPVWEDANGNADKYGIQIKENWWKKLLHTISFRHFYNDATLEIKIRANDAKYGIDTSGVDKYYYYIEEVSDENAIDNYKVKTAEELDKLSANESDATIGFVEVQANGNSAVMVGNLSKDANYVIYAYAVDKAGNKSEYICTEGIVRDTTIPSYAINVPDEEYVNDTEGTFSFEAPEDLTLLYFYVHANEFKTVSEYEQFVTDMKDYYKKLADSSSYDNNRYLPLAKKEDDGKWAPNFTNDGEKVQTSFGSKKEIALHTCQVPKGHYELTISDLQPTEACTVWMVSIDRAGNISSSPFMSFTTTKALPWVAKVSVLTGFYGDKPQDLTITPGVAMYGDVEVQGEWKITETNTTPLQMNTTATCQVTFIPDANLYPNQFKNHIFRVRPVIQKRPITINVADMTMGYGEDIPQITDASFDIAEGEGKGLAGSDTKETIQNTLSLRTLATRESDCGKYSFTISSNSSNYEVMAKYYENLSNLSNSKEEGAITITKAAGEIIQNEGFTASKTVVYKDPAFSLNVSPNSREGKLTYEVKNSKDTEGRTVDDERILSVSDDGKVTVKSPGSAKITIYLPATKNYTAAKPLTVDVTVNKKAYTVEPVNKKYLYSKENEDAIDLLALLPKDCGSTNFEASSTTDSSSFIELPQYKERKLAYKLAMGDIGKKITITVPLRTDNYVINGNNTLTINLELVEQKPLKPQGEITLQKNEMTYGEPLSVLQFNEAKFVDADTGEGIVGTLAWNAPDYKLKVGQRLAEWTFIPDNVEYAPYIGYTTVTVNKAVPHIVFTPDPPEQIYRTSAYSREILNGLSKNPGTVIGVDNQQIGGIWKWEDENWTPTVGQSERRVYFEPLDTQHYENSAMETVILIVKKARPYIQIEPQISDYTHGDTLYSQKLTGSAIYGDGRGNRGSDDAYGNETISGTFTWVTADTKLSHQNDNGKTCEYVFTPADTTSYETVKGAFTITVNKAQNPPQIPSSKMQVDFSCEQVSDVKLPTGWIWTPAEGQDTTLTVGNTITVTATYTASDSVNYENLTVDVAITRSSCEHAKTERRGEVKATCIAAGSTGELWCLICDEKLMESTETAKDSTNHTALTSRVTKQPTTTEEGVMTYECSDCGYITTKPIAKIAAKNDADAGSFNNSNDSGSDSESSGSMNNVHKDVTQPAKTTPALDPSLTPILTPTPIPDPVQPTQPADNVKKPQRKAQTAQNDTVEEGEEARPFIQGEDDKEGWDVIRAESAVCAEGGTIVVNMNGSSVVPGDIFDMIKGKDITMQFELDNGIIWQVNGMSVQKENISDIDFHVALGEEASDTIPVDLINALTGERFSMNLTLAYDGAFGFEAVMRLNVGEANKGLVANLFYYNVSTDALEFICADEIDETGQAELTFTHASDYIIILDTVSMEAVEEADETLVADTTSDNTVQATTTEDHTLFIWIIVLACIAALTATGFLTLKKRKEE